MTTLYENTKIREQAEHLVRTDIYCCVSSLISSLAQSEEAQRGLGVHYDDLSAILSTDDWETPAGEWINAADREELRGAYDYLAITYELAPVGDEWADEDDERRELRQALQTLVEEDEEAARELCDYEREEAHMVEAYEHWIVSDWLAARLEEQGEMVCRDLLGMTIWGRPTTGQAISMDGVILRIAQSQVEA